MRLNVHWRDLLIGVAGLWLMASPVVLGYDLDTTPAANAYAVGTGLIFFCLISAWRLEELGNEIVNILLGFWLLLAPYALAFFDQRAPTINAIAVGMLVIALAIWDMSALSKTK